MYRKPNLQWFVSTLLALAIAAAPVVPRAGAAPPPRDRGQGDLNRADPCTHLPNPPGKANGIEKQCPAAGSSSGIVKGDFNGDGYADLVIGEPGAEVGGAPGAGDVFVLYGSANGLTTNASGIPGGWQFFSELTLGLGPQTNDGFGFALASGDFNGDGYSDLAIGIPFRTVQFDPFNPFTVHKEAGEVVILYGSSSGLSKQNMTSFIGYQFDLQFPTSGVVWDYAHLGRSLAWGNFNGDQYNGHDIGDLAIGIPDATLNACSICPWSYQNVGAVWLLGGNAVTGLNLTTLNSYVTESNPSTSVGAHFGQALRAGDFDGDGISELVVGAPRKSFGSLTERGHVVVYRFPFSSQSAYEWTAVNLQITAENYDELGASLAVGDFNGDGKADLAIGIPGKISGGQTHAGAVVVMYGPGPENLTAPIVRQVWDETAISSTPQGGDQFGTTLAAGDFDGEGHADLAVGMPYKTVVVTRNGSPVSLLNAGEVDVIYGSSTGLSTAAVRGPQRWNQETALGAGAAAGGNQFGASLTAWNFGRNELTGVFPLFILRKTADLAIGAPTQTVKGVSGAGAVDVMYGSFVNHGLTSAGNVIFTADSIGLGGLPGAHFGRALY